VDAWEARYLAYFERHSDGAYPMHPPLPKVFLIPGIGMVTSARNAKDAAVIADVALRTLSVATRGKDAHGAYESLTEANIFHVDYWPLELYKLTLAPAPKEFEGRIVLVTGAASGIGRTVARHLAGLGAQTVLLDLDGTGLEETARMIAEDAAPGALTIQANLTEECSVREAIRRAVETYGGIDGLVSNAGIAAAGRLTEIEPDFWRRSMEVNTTSHFLITAEAIKAMAAQGLGGSIVYVASKNAFGPGAGFGAYSAAKAAQVQLARIAAMEGGPHGIRSNVVNPDAVFEGSKIWSDEVRAERAAAHGVPVEELEAFYAKRNLLGTKISPRDVAEAVAFLLSDRSKATTGTVITVDGGVAAAFPR
jgi:NAD(P)-dependent dehydrogenase (short-subunit alcohol dehydrogenase family)